MPLGESFPRILDAAQAGADWAWRELYRDVAPGLARYLRARGVPDVEDLVGETFVRVVRRVEGFTGDEPSFRTWVFTIGRHLAIDEARRRKRHRSEAVADARLHAIGPMGDGEADAMALMAVQNVRKILDRLTPDQRDVLLLRILGGLTIAEIAAIVGRREGAVKMLQARGLATVKREIAKGTVTL
jgi:RNA polymerase sigma-70 factor (ECF subfamily)